MMRKETWTCDACDTPLPTRPVLFLAVIEAPPDGKGALQTNTELCQSCMDRAVEAIDPNGYLRANIAKRLGREPTFYVHGKR